MKHRPHLLTFLLAVACLPGTVAVAEVYVVDDTTVGTVYDSVLDGSIILPPPSFGTVPADGTPDSQGQPLAVAKVTGGVEQRPIAEFPLASLSALLSTDVDTATLTFNIDDVLGSFWPHSGATFDNTAAQSIVVFSYAGDGTIQLADFNNVVGAPAGIVDTFTPHGTITDATLSGSGALHFNVDITTRIKDALDNGDTHIGIVWATTDSPTGTSLDNLGVAGAAMPRITVTTVPDVPPVFDPDERSCQQKLGIQARGYASFLHAQLQLCFNRVIKDSSLARPLDAAADFCAKALDIGHTPPSKIDKKRALVLEKILDACPSPLTPASIDSPCDDGAANFTDTANCVLDAHFEQVQQMMRTQYSATCPIAFAAGIDLEYPVLCEVQ